MTDPTLLVCLEPSGRNASLRADQLPQDALDIMAFAFTRTTKFGMPICGIEVRLDNPTRNMLLNDDNGCHVHAGSDLLHYFKHADDVNWAVIFPNDCSGNVENGRRILRQYMHDLM